MTSRDFCYWLQGFFEVSGADSVTPEQTKVIQNHLNMVFKHEIDPSHGDAAHQAALAALHKPGPPRPTTQGVGGGGTGDLLLRC